MRNAVFLAVLAGVLNTVGFGLLIGVMVKDKIAEHKKNSNKSR